MGWFINSIDILLDMLVCKIASRACFSQSVIINYQDLKAGKNLQSAIETAYGPKGHGILFVDNIPDFIDMRRVTLPLIWKQATLPKSTLKKYERPQIFHSQGWSRGVQKFNGKYDTAKGSYYVNCCTDEPQQIRQQDRKYYSDDEIKMNVGNKWVEELPEVEKNVKSLSALMISVGVLLSKQIDMFAKKSVSTYESGHLTRIVSTGKGHIGRMLNYFPFEDKGDTEDDWCGWHNDHGSLTALTPAMYINAEGKEVTLKTSTGGLYAQNRFADMARIAIPPQMLAFQLGESTQIHTGGFLEATPHCVIRSEEISGKNISRSTFALFMEPDHMEKMSIPEGIPEEKVRLTKAYKIPQLKERWTNGMFFKDFHQKTIQSYS